MKILLLMLQFFTRIPIRCHIEVNEDDFAKGIVLFPIIGLIIGGLNVLGFLLLSLIFSKIVTIIFVCLLNLLITGALHVDGLADTCDGVFSGRPKEKVLEIMRDSRIGTFGTIAILFDLILRIALLMQIRDANIGVALILAPVISRTALTFLISFSPAARLEKGLGNLFLGKTRWRDAIIALLICIIVTAIFLKYLAIVVIGCNAIVMLLYARFILDKIDGMTGDTLGAGNEVSEILVYISILLLNGLVK